MIILQVKPYLSKPFEMWWISVEDSRIAPLGTNIKADFLNIYQKINIVSDDTDDISADDMAIDIETDDLINNDICYVGGSALYQNSSERDRMRQIDYSKESRLNGKAMPDNGGASTSSSFISNSSGYVTFEASSNPDGTSEFGDILSGGVSDDLFCSNEAKPSGRRIGASGDDIA